MGGGGVAACIVLYLDPGVSEFDHNLFEAHTAVKGTELLPAGEAEIILDFAYLSAQAEAGKGTGNTLFVEGIEVATGIMDTNVAGRFGVDTCGIGEDSGQPVRTAHKAPSKFTGGIESVVVEIQ